MKMEPLSDARAIVELQVQMLGAGISPAPLDMPKPVTDPIDPVREDEDDVVVGEPDVDDEEVVGGEGPQADGKEFFGQRGSDGFFYFAKADGDLKVADSDDNIVFSAQKANLPVEDVVQFLITAAKELKLDSIGMDILQHYDLLAPRREEGEEPEKLEAPKVDEPKAEEPEAPPPDEPPTDGGSELPATIESRVNEREWEAVEDVADVLFSALHANRPAGSRVQRQSRGVAVTTARGRFYVMVMASTDPSWVEVVVRERQPDGEWVEVERESLGVKLSQEVWHSIEANAGMGDDPDEVAKPMTPSGVEQLGKVAVETLKKATGDAPASAPAYPPDSAPASAPASAPSPGSGEGFDEKDASRIQGIIAKSKGDAAKAVKLAKNMAMSIKDADKLKRRAAAARAAGREDLANEFDTEYMGGPPTEESRVNEASKQSVIAMVDKVLEDPKKNHNAAFAEVAAKLKMSELEVEEIYNEVAAVAAESRKKETSMPKTEGKVPVVTSPEDKIINDLLEKHGLSEAVPGVSQAEAVPGGAPSPGQMTRKKDPMGPATKEPQKGAVVADKGSAPDVVSGKDAKIEGVPAGEPSPGQPNPKKDKHFPTSDPGPEGKKLPEAPKAAGVKTEGRVPADPTALDTEEQYIKDLLEKLN